uniref:Uncharacterized protein n=1 Tax=Aegilops tauschii TaxID=37682 RepID=M8BR79_AEGTA
MCSKWVSAGGNALRTCQCRLLKLDFSYKYRRTEGALLKMPVASAQGSLFDRIPGKQEGLLLRFKGLLFGALDQEHMEGALLHRAGNRNKENPVHGATNEQGWFAQGAAVFKIYHVLKCLKAYVVY